MLKTGWQVIRFWGKEIEKDLPLYLDKWLETLTKEISTGKTPHLKLIDEINDIEIDKGKAISSSKSVLWARPEKCNVYFSIGSTE